MEQERKSNIIAIPLIDAKNPPVGVDSVLLGEAATGAVRLSCFAGDAFIEKEENISINGADTKRLWIRPVCVVDIAPEAVKFLESYLLYRLIENENDMQYAVKNFPDLMEKLYIVLGKRNENDKNV